MSAQTKGGVLKKRKLLKAAVGIQLLLAALTLLAIASGFLNYALALAALGAVPAASIALLVWEIASAQEGLDSAQSARLKEVHDQRLKDLTSANQRLDELTKALESAEKQYADVSRCKADFLAHINHEIRTPLNAVVGMAELLSRTELSKEQHELVSLIGGSGETLLSVINDILNYSKIESGEFNLTMQEFDLNDLVEGTAQLLVEQSRLREVSLTSFVSPTLPSAYFGDAERLKQVLLNLLGNALRFAQKGDILVSADEDPDRSGFVRLSVKDSSSSMTKSVVASLFTPMTEVDMITARKYGGTGLGLSVSKKLVELMTGKMGIETQEEDGTTFWFSVPLQAAPEAIENGADQVAVDKKVMLVGNASSCAAVVMTYIKSWGLGCEYEPAGAESLEAMVAKPDDYQAVIVESSTTDMSVAGFLTSFFGKSELSAVHAIVLTEDEQSEQELKTLGWTLQTLRKPFKKAQLREALRQCHLAVLRTGDLVRPEAQLKSFIASMDFATRPCNPEPTEVKPATHILIVEDNPVNRRLVHLQLRTLGLSCDNVENGEAAVEAVASGQYRLVFMDCWMPVLDGFAATAKIRQAELRSQRHTTIVAMTANAMESDRQACLDAGMDDYLSKPVTSASLKGILEKWLSSEARPQMYESRIEQKP